MKITTRLAALLATLAIVAAACGGGTSTAPSTAPSTEPSASAAATEVPFPTGDFALSLWTKEGEADGALQYGKAIADAFHALHANVTIEVINKNVETLREDFVTAGLGEGSPDILWTVADHIGPFTAADLLLPLDDLVDGSSYVPAAAAAVTADGKLWGAPVSFGNQLMLYWNKTLAGDTAPADSDAWVAKAKELTSAPDSYGIVFNQTESFWLVPFLGGFGGSVFDADGVTPTLNTDAMKSALQFLYDLKYTAKVTPAEADYNVAEGLFKAGKAAYIINGDWALGNYSAATDAETPGLGDALAVGPLPKLVGGDYPKPYIAGAFLMVSKAVGDDADRQTVVSEFLKFATNKENQVNLVTTLKRLPGNAEAIADPVVAADTLLAGAAEAAQKGVPQPTNLEMRCVFDSMTPAVKDLFAGNSDIDGIVETMQTSAETCIAQLG